jgi:hypothetical protein
LQRTYRCSLYPCLIDDDVGVPPPPKKTNCWSSPFSDFGTGDPAMVDFLTSLPRLLDERRICYIVASSNAYRYLTFPVARRLWAIVVLVFLLPPSVEVEGSRFSTEALSTKQAVVRGGSQKYLSLHPTKQPPSFLQARTEGVRSMQIVSDENNLRIEEYADCQFPYTKQCHYLLLPSA